MVLKLVCPFQKFSKKTSQINLGSVSSPEVHKVTVSQAVVSSVTKLELLVIRTMGTRAASSRGDGSSLSCTASKV